MTRFARLTIGMLVLLGGVSTAHPETVNVKYRGPVDLQPFECIDVNRSSFIDRVCYDGKQQYMLIKLRRTYYHYCELPPAALQELLTAPSIGQYFNANIKGSGKDGPYDCRTHRGPSY